MRVAYIHGLLASHSASCRQVSLIHSDEEGNDVVNEMDIPSSLIELCLGELPVHNRDALSELSKDVASRVELVIVLHAVRLQTTPCSARQYGMADKTDCDYIDVRNRVEPECRRI